MLREILALMASGGTHTLESLALDLELSSAELEDMLTRLSSLGYIEELSAALSSSCMDGERKACAGCSGCGFVSGCGQAPKNRVWSLTSKGREIQR
jgi:hypothetical protein